MNAAKKNYVIGNLLESKKAGPTTVQGKKRGPGVKAYRRTRTSQQKRGKHSVTGSTASITKKRISNR